MAISSVSGAGALAILTGGKTNVSAILQSLSSQSTSATQLSQKATFDKTRADLLKAIAALSELQGLVGTPAQKLGVDKTAPTSPQTLQDRIDQAATASSLDSAISGYNRQVNSILSGLRSLPGFSSRDQFNDKGAIDAAYAALQTFVDPANPNSLIKAGKGLAAGNTSAVDLSVKGNANGTDNGRSDARRVANYLGQAIESTIETLKTEVQSIDYRLAGVNSSLYITGTSTADTSKAKALSSLQTQLINIQRTASYVSRQAGGEVADLDGNLPYPIAPATLQDYVTYAGLSGSEQAGADGFNSLRKNVVSALGGLSDLSSSALIDKGGINRAIDQLTSLVDKKNPNALLAARGTSAAPTTGDATYDFTAPGNSDGTDGKRSDARSAVNDLRYLADELGDAVSKELASVSAQLAALQAANAAAGGGSVGNAAAELNQAVSAKNTVSAALAQLSAINDLAGSLFSQTAKDEPPAGASDTLSNAIGRAADDNQRKTAVNDYNRTRDQIIAALNNLPSLQGSVFTDPNAVTAAGDSLVKFIKGTTSGQLLAASATTQLTKDGLTDSSVFDFSKEGNASGTDAARSQARLTLNNLLTNVRQAYEVYSQELLQLNLKAQIASVAQQASVAALNASLGSSGIFGLLGGGQASGPQLQSQAARSQVQSALKAIDNIQSVVGGSVGPSGGAASRGAKTLQEVLDQASSSSLLGSAVTSYNSKLTSILDSVNSIKSINTSGLVDKVGVTTVKSVLAQYFDSEGAKAKAGIARTDKLRQATSLTTAPAAGAVLPDKISLGYAGNAAGTDGGRTEARRVLDAFSSDVAWARTVLSNELLSQDTNNLGSVASSALTSYLQAQNAATTDNSTYTDWLSRNASSKRR